MAGERPPLIWAPFMLPRPRPPPPPPPPRPLGLVLRLFEVAVPNNSCLRSSYLRCFSSRSLARWASTSAGVSFFSSSSSSSSDDAPLLATGSTTAPSFVWEAGGGFFNGLRERRTGGGLNSVRWGTTLRDSRKKLVALGPSLNKF